ncbi:type IV pilus biogenesis protein PilM [Erwinia sorbitola]|uniref:Pilus assembly protein n=1 Tax=Erwinia sorbitola TaxID=2681984 RepID=A0ABW9RHZ6_9GAMM|nr:pilus assembly protein PilM [Erwinia sorbitola]MTD29145.1 pilus assembly protein [Erwinia sorbitola]
MAFKTWQVGLDIQNGQLCALGIQRRRNGWQLRHWWHHTLPQDTLRNGLVQRPDAVVTLLQRWRKQLPARISLRVGFPPQLVMQRQLAQPALQLREPDRSSYIVAAARRFFPFAPEALALDYRCGQDDGGPVYLTAARQEALKNWVDCLQQASLTPDVLELTPAALFALARTLALDTSAALVHRLSDHWLWYAPHSAEHPWGWCSLEEAADFNALQQRYLQDSSTVWYSTALDEARPEGTHALSPLAALQLYQPPLPRYDGVFSLATGLALRPEDR